MTRSLLNSMVVVSLLIALPTSAAWAHKVNVFAYSEGHTVYTESYFPDGRAVENGAIEVRDAHGNKLLGGKTDSKGLFSFPLSKKEELTIVVNATMGHKNSFVLKQSEQ